MNKKFLLKVTAIVVCCCVLLLSFPVTSAAKKPSKLNHKFLRDPVRIIFNIVPFVEPVDRPEKAVTTPKSNPQKLAGTMRSKKVSDGD